MEAFEFLGGQYNRPEQIMSGPVQAFRAQSPTDGKTVFIHRVSTTEAPAEQASLLKLLTAALVKSSEAKRLVLDFGEESGYWYVVTRSEPQCALLREWLQLEIETAAGNPRPAIKSADTPIIKSPGVSRDEAGEFTRFLEARTPVNPPGSTARSDASPPSPLDPENDRTQLMVPNRDPLNKSPLKPELPRPDPPKQELPKPENEPGPSEFSQLFASSPNKTPRAVEPLRSAGSPAAGVPSTPTHPAPPAVQRPTPGEFTKFFNTSDAERKESSQGPIRPGPQRPTAAQPPPNIPLGSGTSKPEPGEFTRFFQPGLPPVAPKPSSTPQSPNSERAQSTPLVQRPNTPVGPPPSNPKPTEGGEFTQLFARPENAKAPAQPPAAKYQPPPPERSDPFGFTKPQSTGKPNDLSEDLFNDKIDIPKPLPPPQPKEGEFTRMFGGGGTASPPVQKQSVVAPPREKSMLEGPSVKEDPLLATQRFPEANQQGSAPAGNEASANSPSEFTRIMQGGYGPAKAPTGSGAPPAGAKPPAGRSGSPLLNVNVSASNPAGALSHLSSAGGSAGSAHASASASGASVGTPAGAANVYAPRIPGAHIPSANLAVPPPSVKGGNKKMIIFFAIIGILAVLLIILVLFVMKTK